MVKHFGGFQEDPSPLKYIIFKVKKKFLWKVKKKTYRFHKTFGSLRIPDPEGGLANVLAENHFLGHNFKCEVASFLT